MTDEAGIAPETNEGFKIPSGYVLVEQQVYDFLLGKKGEATQNDSSEVIHLDVLRQFHLGDIRTQLNPGERVEWSYGKSLTVRGKVNNMLGSFLSVWNKQDPYSRTYDKVFGPVFRVANVSALEKVTGLDYSRHWGSEGEFQESTPEASQYTEKGRIEREEKSGDAARTPVKNALGVQGLKATQTPQIAPEDVPGSEARKAMIHSHGAERALHAETQGNRSNDGAEMSVQDFQTTTKPNDYRTVAKVGGPSADATPIIATEKPRRR